MFSALRSRAPQPSATTLGRLIVLEGVDGTGKSTIATRLTTTLLHAGDHGVVHCFREPGTTPMGMAIRTLAKGKIPRDSMTDLYLFCAARCELVRTVITPALLAGQTVILDRFTLSTFAYQGAAAGVPSATIAALTAPALSELPSVPITTLLLTAPEEVTAARRSNREEIPDKFELHETLKRAAAFYDTQRPGPSPLPGVGTIVRVDASGDLESTFVNALAAVESTARPETAGRRSRRATR